MMRARRGRCWKVSVLGRAFGSIEMLRRSRTVGCDCITECSIKRVIGGEGGEMSLGGGTPVKGNRFDNLYA